MEARLAGLSRAQGRDGRRLFFFSSRRRHTRFDCDWSSDVCSSDLATAQAEFLQGLAEQDCGWFARASGGILLLATVNQAVEKRSGSDDDSPRADRADRKSVV